MKKKKKRAFIGAGFRCGKIPKKRSIKMLPRPSGLV
jgi:hypothetical protein